MTDQTQAAPTAAKPVYARMAVIGLGERSGSSTAPRPWRCWVDHRRLDIARHRARQGARHRRRRVRRSGEASTGRRSDRARSAGDGDGRGDPRRRRPARRSPTSMLKARGGRGDGRARPPRRVRDQGHPVAGTEQSGPDAGFATLFENRWNILTPQQRDDAPYQAAIERLTEFWMRLGARVELMDAAHHDLVLAVTYTAPDRLQHRRHRPGGSHPGPDEVLAGGFRDSASPPPTRSCGATCSSPTRMRCWRSSADLQALSRAIRWGEEKLEALFTRTREITAIVAAGRAFGAELGVGADSLAFGSSPGPSPSAVA